MANPSARKFQAIAISGALYAHAALASGDMRVLLPLVASVVASLIFLAFIYSVGVRKQRNILLAVLAASTVLAWALSFTWSSISAWPTHSAVVVGIPALCLVVTMLGLARLSR